MEKKNKKSEKKQEKRQNQEKMVKNVEKGTRIIIETIRNDRLSGNKHSSMFSGVCVGNKIIVSMCGSGGSLKDLLLRMVEDNDDLADIYMGVAAQYAKSKIIDDMIDVADRAGDSKIKSFMDKLLREISDDNNVKDKKS